MDISYNLREIGDRHTVIGNMSGNDIGGQRNERAVLLRGIGHSAILPAIVGGLGLSAASAYREHQHFGRRLFRQKALYFD